jgi:ATP dependent DNA ligase domain
MSLRLRTLPAGFIVPCLHAKRLPSGAGWLHGIKHDGFRCIARKDGKRVRLYSRPGNDLTRRFTRIVEAVARLKARTCIIDGEAVACRPDCIALFDLIRYRQYDERVFLRAFDIIELNGDDLRREALVSRKVTLAIALAGTSWYRTDLKFREDVRGQTEGQRGGATVQWKRFAMGMSVTILVHPRCRLGVAFYQSLQSRTVEQHNPLGAWQRDHGRVLKSRQRARDSFDREAQIIGDVLSRHWQLHLVPRLDAVRHFEQEGCHSLRCGLDQQTDVILGDLKLAPHKRP